MDEVKVCHVIVDATYKQAIFGSQVAEFILSLPPDQRPAVAAHYKNEFDNLEEQEFELHRKAEERSPSSTKLESVVGEVYLGFYAIARSLGYTEPGLTPTRYKMKLYSECVKILRY